MTLRPTVRALLLSTALLAACEAPEAPTDDTDVDTEPAGAPIARVGTDAVDLGTVCAATTADVIVTNDGDAPLTLTSIGVTGGDWDVLDDAPATVAAGEQAVISVSGSSGDGTLTIETDDAANPTLTVALSAVQNQPPTVTIADHGDVVPPGGRATFTASVTDDDPDGVTLVWRSSEDGELDAVTYGTSQSP